MHYQKPPISPHNAVLRLIDKGLQIHDQEEAKKLITFVSYFRLRGYCLPFMQAAPAGHAHGTRIFTPGTTWQKIKQAYDCDRLMRSAISSQLERIEIAFRSVLVEHMAHKHHGCFYNDLTLGFASSAYEHMDWLIDSMKEIKRSGEHPIKQYLKTYKTPPLPPAWYVTEAFTFTRWSLLYKMMTHDKGAIAKPFNVPPDVLDSWMHNLSVLRNMCAHHSRLFGKKLTLQPTALKKHKNEFSEPNRLYAQLVVIQLLTRVIDGNNDLASTFQNMAIKFPLLNLTEYYGIPQDWHLREIWAM